MAFKYLAGSLLNLVGRGAQYGATPSGPVVLSVTADTSYPLVNAYNGIPALACRLAAVSSGAYVSFSNNLVVNGDMEQGTTGWTAVDATLTSEAGAGNYHKGVKSLKVVTSVGSGGAYQDVTVQAGEYLQLWAAVKSDGANEVGVIARCLDTMKDVQSDGTWAPSQNTLVRSGNTMAAITPVTFQAPTFAEVGRPTVTIRVQLVGDKDTAAHTFYCDEVLLVPGIDFVGVFGHGWDSSTGVSLQTSGADYWHSPSYSAVFGTPANLALARQVGVVTNASRVYEPYPAVKFNPGGNVGTAGTIVAPWIGELVVGQVRTMPSETTSLTISPSMKGQNRQTTRGGTTWVYNAGKHSLRKATVGFFDESLTAAKGMADEMLGMSEGGRYPVVLIPSDVDATTALYGRVTDSMNFSYQAPAGIYSTTEVTVEEEALPSL